MTQGYSYRHPATTKPPSAISALGRVVKSLTPDTYLSAREIFSRAFAPHEDYDACRVTIGTATAREYAEKQWESRKPNRYRLTQRGAEIKQMLDLR